MICHPMAVARKHFIRMGVSSLKDMVKRSLADDVKSVLAVRFGNRRTLVIILVTGVAGFIGYSVALEIIKKRRSVRANNLNNYCDTKIKNKLAELDRHPGFNFEVLDISDGEKLNNYFTRNSPKCVVHLAAQAGVQYSLVNPSAYVRSNLIGFVNMFEAIRFVGNVEQFCLVSTSSVYGSNKKKPFRSMTHR